MTQIAERILLIGDTERAVQHAITSAIGPVPMVSTPTYFEAISELARERFTTVVASIEPVERRPESAVRAVREMLGSGRVLVFCPPMLEPLTQRLTEHGADDYLVLPASTDELRQMFGTPVVRLADPARSAGVGDVPIRLADQLSFADALLEQMLLHPGQSAEAVAQLVASQLPGDVQIAYRRNGAPAEPAPEGTLVTPVRAGQEDAGELRLTVPEGHDPAPLRHLAARVAQIAGKVVALHDRVERLQKLAITDDLTGVYNGRYFRHFLSKILEKARARRFSVTLLMFDIDDFKRYNDLYGHGVGDRILCQTAAIMKRCSREHDVVARIGGDEFAVIFWEKEGPRQPRQPSSAAAPGRNPHTPMQVLERFRRLIATETFEGLGTGGKGTLTISGALAVYPFDAQDADGLIRAADRALMFEAKKGGKNSIALVGGGRT